MNIGYFILKDWYPPVAGSRIHAYQVASKLMEMGHTINTIFQERSAPGTRSYGRAELWRYLRDIDVIYVRVAPSFENVTWLKMLTFGSTPVVWEINAPMEERRSFGWSEEQIARAHRRRRRLAPLVDACICNTPALAEYATSKWRIRRSFVVPLGSDPELFRHRNGVGDALAPYSGRFKVIWAGTAENPWHDLETTLQVARLTEAIDKDIVFLVTAQPGQMKKFQPLPSNVAVVDRKDYFDIPGYIGAADVGLCLYTGDESGIPFYRSPLKLFDYMACAAVPIVSDSEETRRIIQHGVNGVAIDNGAEQIVDWILRLKRDPSRKREMGLAARGDVERYYNWKRVAADTEAILLEALRKRRGWRSFTELPAPARVRQ